MPPSFVPAQDRVLKLEKGQEVLRSNLNILTEQYQQLSSAIDKLKVGGWPVTVGPFQEQDTSQLRQSARELHREFDELSRKSVDGAADTDNEAGFHNSTGRGFAVPSPNSRLVTDGPVDIAARPQPALTPPQSPTKETTAEPTVQTEADSWQPHFLTTLKPYSSPSIPSAQTTTNFHPEFLSTILGGTDWSPGLRFIPGTSKTCLLKNRTYYLLDPANEPYLPTTPGTHGAKLTAFFNASPEEHFGDLPEGLSSYEDVPMFIRTPTGRYTYFGSYTQTRWSDKLSYDEMVSRVPTSVKQYWAKELTSSVRQEWVTAELKKHFFKKPEYEGRMYVLHDQKDDATVSTEAEVKNQARMEKDVKKYVDALREWEREADMRVSMVKPAFIMDAFHAVSCFPGVGVGSGCANAIVLG